MGAPTSLRTALFSFGFASLLFGAESVRERLSPVRLPFQSYEDIARSRDPISPVSDPASKVAQSLDKTNFASIPEFDLVSSLFKRLRDERYLRSPDDPTFPRRSSWLYPYDGCFARAALSAQRFGQWGKTRPKKLFVFGDLVVRTPNAKGGQVTWWYHVVPTVKDKWGSILVLDPSIDPNAPLEVTDWLSRMGDPAKLKIAICDSYSFGPFSSCSQPKPDEEKDAMEDEYIYLKEEWLNLKDLNRDPFTELGDSPPWSTLFFPTLKIW